MKVESYRDLIVWQKAMELVVEIYRVTDLLPQSERFGLSTQMRRASVSIPSNIAEGCRRSHRNEYRQFASIAYASGAELETQIEICNRITTFQKIDLLKAEKLLDEVMRMLNVLIEKLNS